MTEISEKLMYKQNVKASSDLVFRAFTNSSMLREWLCDFATTDPKPGGRIYMWWNAGYYTCGEFISLEKDNHIMFTWFGKGEPNPTQVEITVKEKSDSTDIKLVHSGIGSAPEWQEIVQEFDKGWVNGLENLVSVLETGEDLRFTRRPMLGIGINDFNEEIAKKLDIPVKEGIRIDSAISGMGAEAAGLGKDDVIVAMGGESTTDFASLSNALSSYHAGDTIEVSFYRGSEKKSVDMKLSGRPIPDIPETGEALSEATRKIYNEVFNQLKEFLNGIREEEASFRPSINEWSVNDTMAHLIHGERGWHTFIQDLVGGHEAWYDDFGDNVQARIEATISAYPTKQQLLEELERSAEETLAMLANLPEEFVNRKGGYWRLGYNILQSPFHFNNHMGQMRSAAQAARNQ